MGGKIEARLKELGITLPVAGTPLANYVPYVVSGSLVFISGQLPSKDGGMSATGQVGKEVTIEQAAEAAKLCALHLIAHLKNACGGDLDRVRRVIRLGGFVNAGPEFGDHPKVVNGASNLMVEVFGDAGKHARVAAGFAGLPFRAAVEVEGTFEIA